MFATGGACLCGLTTGLATCFGAWTVMLGSWLARPVAVCEAAVPLSNTVDRTVIAEDATRLDDILITRFPMLSPVRMALPVSIFCSDPKFSPVQHAGAIPPGSLVIPAQEHFGFYALHVVPVRERIFAGC